MTIVTHFLRYPVAHESVPRRFPWRNAVTRKSRADRQRPEQYDRAFSVSTLLHYDDVFRSSSHAVRLPANTVSFLCYRVRIRVLSGPAVVRARALDLPGNARLREITDLRAGPLVKSARKLQNSLICMAKSARMRVAAERVSRRGESLSLPRRSQDRTVAVGTALAGGPPRRSQRAELPHWAPASGAGVESHARPWMHDPGLGQPPGGEAVHAFPVQAGALTAAP